MFRLSWTFLSVVHLFIDEFQENGINAELGLAASEDAVLDILSERAEKEIISGGSTEKNLIGLCAPFLSKLCRNFNLMQKVNSYNLRQLLILKCM